METISKLQNLEQEFNYSEELQRGLLANTGSTPRVRKLSASLRSTPARLCLHRARAVTEVFSQTEGEPEEMRVAKAFCKTVQDLPAVINDGELIVGLPSCGLKKIAIKPSAQTWLLDELGTISTRPAYPVQVSPEEAKEARNLLSYWINKSQMAIISKNCPPELWSKVVGTGWGDATGYMVEGGCHFNPYWEVIMEKGLSWYEDRVKKQLASLNYDDPQQIGKEHFYHALLLIVEAIRNFADKYVQKARELAQQEKDPVRKKELKKIATTLSRVPYYGACSFYEAIQSMWFVIIALHIEGTGPVYNIGRFDQFMYPYYKADIEKGVLTSQEAQELMECLFLKMTGNLFLLPDLWAQRFPGFSQVQALNIGGVNSNGKDATNELSYLVLEAVKTVRTREPDIVMLCHPRETPYELKFKGAELVALGLGLPKFINTETIKTQLVAEGYTLEEARIGWIKGCSEPYGPGGKRYGFAAGGSLNLGIALEAVLYNGRKRMPNQPMSGELIGVETGDPRKFKTFEEFKTALKTQIAQQVRDCYIALCYTDKVKMQHFPLPLQSLLTEGCIDRGLTANAGGAIINTGPYTIVAGGTATIADSLAAIKKLVYEEKTIGMDELLQAIEANYEGYELLRQRLINDAPKYGNDIDYVDDLAREVWQFCMAEIREDIMPRGNKNEGADCAVASYAVAGAFTWATPDGRKAGEPLSNHIGPSDQRDICGPVAHIKSTTKIGQDRAFGTVHNMYFTNINNRERLHQLVNLIDLYHSLGGHHLQINCQDKEVLLDAQKHPEKYPSLLIRVAGWMAYFVELPKRIQDEIINRTSMTVE